MERRVKKVAGELDTKQDLDKSISDNLPLPLTKDFVGRHINEMPAGMTLVSFPE